MRIAEKRKAGEILGREGISKQILSLAKEIHENGGFKNAISKGAQIHELINACTYDEYWSEKAFYGKAEQNNKFRLLILNNGVEK